MDEVVTGRSRNEHDEIRSIDSDSVRIAFYPLNTSNGIGIESIRRTQKEVFPEISGKHLGFSMHFVFQEGSGFC